MKMMFRSLYVKRQCFQNSAIQTPLWLDALRTALYLGAAGQGWLGRQGGRALHHPDLPTTTPDLAPLASPVPWHSVRLISFCSLYPHRLMNTLHLPGFSLIFVRGHYEKCESFFFFFSWYDTPSSTVRGVDYKYTKLMQNIIAKKLSLSRVSS